MGALLTEKAVAAIEKILKSKGRAEVVMTKEDVIIKRLDSKVAHKEKIQNV